MTKSTHPFDGAADDHLHEECGIFGIFGNADAAAHTALGLHALQHRGQEAAGIVSFDGEHFYNHRALGHVGDNFGSPDVISRLPGAMAIGHNRYSTTGGTVLRNVQPLFADFDFGGLAIAHNGNLTNAYTVRKSLVERGCIFQSTMDTEIIIHLIATSLNGTVVERMIDALRQVSGAYSLVALTREKLIGVRDPFGVRPLVLGSIDGSYILTSETCALDIIGATYVRDVEPGEIVVIDEGGVQSIKPFAKTPQRFCIFEYIYFSRPDSLVESMDVYEVRKRIGAELARESHIEADMVVPVPDSGVPAAIGYAEQAGVPFELGIIRNHYVGRTFIEPTDQIRHLGVKLKHNANIRYLKDKRVILVDDSIVRGTTSRKIVTMVRDLGAREVHMRISSPPTIGPCYYGVDTPNREELIASAHTVEEIRTFIRADTLGYLSLEGLRKAVSDGDSFCTACFDDNYPIAVHQRAGSQANLFDIPR